MPILKYAELNTNDLQGLARDRTVIFLNVDPIEEHGPHLPYGTDIFQSEKFSIFLSENLEKLRPDWNFVMFPHIPLGCDTLKYPGSIEVQQTTLRSALYDILKQLSKDGFKYVIALTAHGGPRHLIVLEELSERMRWRHRMNMVSASSRMIMDILSGKYVSKIEDDLKTNSPSVHFGEEERKYLKGDFHAGLLETSMMLWIHPKYVQPMYKNLLPSNIEKIWKFNRNSGKTLGEGLGHVGAPHLAKKEVGEALTQIILSELIPVLNRFLNGDDVRKSFRSKFYYIPFLRTDFKWIFVLAAYAVSFALAWHFMIRMMTEVAKP